MKKQTLPIFLWLIFPILMILGQITLELVIKDNDLLSRLHSEGGPQEILQEYLIAAALLTALFCLAKVDWAQKRLVGFTVLAAAIGSFYVLGEEISWGQHKFGWPTPEAWSVVNDQNETNLHNTSSWLDQKPRLLLFIGIVVAGLIVPALRRWKPEKLPAQFQELYPSSILSVTALGVLLPYTFQEIAEHIFDSYIFIRVSEVQEAYMYYFVLLYLLDLYKREISKE